MWRGKSREAVVFLARWAPAIVGALLLSLVSLQPLFAQGSAFTQSDYRWYENRNNKSPNTPLAAENTAITGVALGQVIRLRVNVLVDTQDLAQDSQTFKLQYATSTSGPWTDVGAIGSDSAWRGYDNGGPSDGAKLGSGDLLLSNSNVTESYEEENPSTTNPRAIAFGERGEWDWVVQNNSADAETVYYFRMVEADGTAFSGYTRYPQVTTAPPSTLTQDQYRWFDNRNNKNPATPLANENTAYNATSLTGQYRLRVNVKVTDVAMGEATEAFKLQYATSTSGPWTDVGAIGSAAIWRGYDNASPSDGAKIAGTNLELTNSDVAESYEEENPSASNPRAISTGQWGEWDWVLDANAVSPSTTYYFRMVKSNGEPLDSYTRYPTIVMPAPVSFTQSDYRWYENRNGKSPNTPLAAQNAPYSAEYHNLVYRIRMNLLVSGQPLPTDSRQFKLQYATSTSGPWTDVGAIGSGSPWRGYDNGVPSDGANLGSGDLLLSNSDVAQSYEEENPSASNPKEVLAGERAEWDWVVEDNGAPSNTTYYFRMVESDGTPLGSYTRYPTINTPAELVLTQDAYRWYQNRNGKNPNTPLADENTALDAALRDTVYRLRVNVLVGGVDMGAETESFKLQYATSTSGPWADVGSIGSGTIWRGYNNGSPSDGAKNLNLLLTGSDVSGTYEEENPSAPNPALVATGQRVEWDWVLQHNGAASGTTYYFRMVKSNGEVLSGYNRYPQLSTPGSTVSSNSGSGNPEATVSYTNTITNRGQTADTFDITLNSSASWNVGFYQSDGETPLSDTDGDTVPDTGSLNPGASANVVVRVTVGWNTTTDVTTINSTSSVDPQVSNTGSNTTTAPPTISVSVSDGTAEFGTNLSPQGENSNSPDTVVDFQSSVGNEGTYYVWKSASGNGVSVTVKSNRTWNGTLQASENSGSATSISIASGALRYKESPPASYAECAGATAFTTSPVTWRTNVPPGISDHTYYYCLRIDWTDDPGTFLSTVTYAVSQ